MITSISVRQISSPEISEELNKQQIEAKDLTSIYLANFDGSALTEYRKDNKTRALLRKLLQADIQFVFSEPNSVQNNKPLSIGGDLIVLNGKEKWLKLSVTEWLYIDEI